MLLIKLQTCKLMFINYLSVPKINSNPEVIFSSKTYCKPTIIRDDFISQFIRDELVRGDKFLRLTLIHTCFFYYNYVVNTGPRREIFATMKPSQKNSRTRIKVGLQYVDVDSRDCYNKILCQICKWSNKSSFSHAFVLWKNLN